MSFKIYLTILFLVITLFTTSLSAQQNPGDVDITFDPGTALNSWVQTIAVQPDGKIIVGGAFRYSNSVLDLGRILRFNIDGTLDVGFYPGSGANFAIYSVAIQTDGKILIGGSFTTFNGIPRSRIARLNANGSLDTSFNPGAGFNASVHSIVIQPDGKIIASGLFVTYNGAISGRIVRLNPDATLDTTFNPVTGGFGLIHAVSLQPDGKIIVGGEFNSSTGGQSVPNYVARLNSNGSLDTTFNSGIGANNIIYTTALQQDGKIIIGGLFTSFDGVSRSRIARLNLNGNLDTTFVPAGGPIKLGIGANSIVYTAIVQSDGKVVIGGNFTHCDSVIRNNVARLNTNGKLDTIFDPGTGANNDVSVLALQPDGKILIGGLFTIYNNHYRRRLVRLNGGNTIIPPNPPAQPNINFIAPDTLVSSVAGDSYEWKLNGTTLANSTQKIKATASGAYAIRVINTSNGASPFSADYNFIVTGLPETQTTNLTLYPNPTIGIINLELKDQQPTQIFVYNSLGQTILTIIEAQPNQNGKLQLDLSSHAKGIYTVQVISGNQSLVKKVVLQ